MIKLRQWHGLSCTALRRLYSDRGGNVFMIMAFAAVPLALSGGVAVDYSRAARLETKLNAAADAAALAAVTTPMMDQDQNTAKTAAQNMFNAQVSGLTGLIYNPANLVVTVNDATTTGKVRTVTVSYTAQSKNVFGGLIGLAAVNIRGSSSSTASIAPDIDFYVLLDASGSMALPSTSAGLTLLTSKTGGCAFACHSTNDAKAKDKYGNMTDYYGVATSYGIPLRIDEAKTAVQNMMTLATSTSSSNHANYRAGLWTFASQSKQANNYFTAQQALTANLTAVSNSATNVKTSLYYKNSCPTSSFCNNDQDTASSDAFNQMNQIIPAPGNGTRTAGDKPKAFLFLITDGMRDEYRPGGKPEAAFDTSWCDTLKARNIQIVVLYTEYLPQSLSDSWSQTNVAPNLYKVEPALKNCSSDPTNFYSKVTTDGDISAALNKLFLAAVASARITQ